MATYSKTKSKSVSAGQDSTVEFAAISIPASQQFKRCKVEKSGSYGSSCEMRGTALSVFGGQWDTWKTDKSGIGWSKSGDAPSIKVHNTDTTAHAWGFTVTIETEDKPKYAITVNSGTGGTVTVSKSSTYKGDTVTVTVTPDSNYRLLSIQAVQTGTSTGVSINNNQFTMPAHAVTVTATWTKITYAVTCSSGTGGTLTASKSSAASGDTVTLTATPASGYSLASLTAVRTGTGTAVAISGNSFTMPAAAVTVTATWSNRFTVTLAASPGGTLSANKVTANAGETVTITATPDTGYQLASLSAKRTGTSTSVTITNNSFTMPASGVTVTPVWSKINYTVTVSSATGGSVTASKSTANYGDNITLTISPNTGYQLSSISAMKTGTSTAVTITNNAFTMPASGVTVTPVFAKVNYAVTLSSGTGGTLTANKATANYGDTVTLTPTASTGYSLKSLTAVRTGTGTAVTISSNQFTMPAAGVTVTAVWQKTNYTVTISGGTGGSVTASKTTANYGDTITLTVTPSANYHLSSLTAVRTGTGTAVAISSNKFTMPASGVTVTAAFAKDSYAITKKANPTGGGTVTGAGSAEVGTSVTMSQTAATGYYFNGWTISSGTISSGGVFTMPATAVTVTANYLKRSTATINKTTLTGGDSAVLTISPDKATYSHSYRIYKSGTNLTTGWVTVAAGTTSVTVSIPATWSQYVTTATSLSGLACEVRTYSGSTLIGTYTVSGSLTYAVPASQVPTVAAFTPSIALTVGGTTYESVGNYYVQSHCGVSVSASASGVQGSSIVSMSLTMSGYSGSSYSTTAAAASLSFTSGLLTKAGSCTITVTATDSRGRTGSRTATITVTAYNKPSGSLRVWRVDSNGDEDDMGTYGKYTLGRVYTAVGTNAWTINRLTCQSTNENSPAATGDLLPSSRKTFQTNSEYTVTLTLKDKFEQTTITVKLPSARYIIYTDATGDHLSFMKAANKATPSGKASTVEFAGDSQIYIGDSLFEDYVRSCMNRLITPYSLVLAADASSDTTQTFNTYDSRKFSDYRLLVFFLYESASNKTLVRNTLVLPGSVWESGKSVQIIQNHGASLENVSGVQITYSSDTQVRAYVIGAGLLTGFEIFGYRKS